LWVVPFGIWICVQAPDLSEDQPTRAARGPPGPSGEGRAPGRVRLAPPDYRTRPECAYLPEVAGFAGRPQCRQPEARSARRRPVAVDYAVRVPSGRQPVINLSMYSSILTGGGIGVGRQARQVRGK